MSNKDQLEEFKRAAIKLCEIRGLDPYEVTHYIYNHEKAIQWQIEALEHQASQQRKEATVAAFLEKVGYDKG